VIADGGNRAAKTSQSKKVNRLKDDDDDDDDSTDSEDEEDVASDSENEPADDDVDDEYDAEGDDDQSPDADNAPATNAAVTSPAECRKRRLQQLEDFVKSKSSTNVKSILKASTSTNVKSILKASTPSSTSSTKLVKFAGDDDKTDDDDSAPVYREDIYGRLRDEHGNVVNRDELGVASREGGAYVPPGKRQKLAEESASLGIDKSTDESKQRVAVLTRQIKGQINRSVSVHILCPESSLFIYIYPRTPFGHI